MTLNALFEQFIMDRELLGLSEASITSYRSITTVFLHQFGNKEYINLSRNDVDCFIRKQLHRPISRNTVVSYVRNVKIFLCWVYENYDLSFDPHKIRLPKAPKKNVHIFNDIEVDTIFDSITSSYPWIEARNKAIVAIMLDSGLRLNEVSTLYCCNIDYQRMIMKVTGKGAKDRLVPFGNVTKSYISDYLLICPYTSKYLFVDRFGNMLSRNAIQQFVNKIKHELNVDLSSHKLRHNFATNYCIDNLKIKGNTNIYDLSVLMGHSTIETTKRYEHFAHELIAAESSISHLDLIQKKSKSQSF